MLATHFSSSSLVLEGLNLNSAICFAKQRVRSELRNSLVTTWHQLMNIQKLCLTVTAQQLGDRIVHIMHSFWGSCTIHVSNIIVELKKLIQMIILLTDLLCWRSNFKTSCFGFHQVSKRSKTKKPLGLRPRGFKCFSRLETWWNPKHEVLKYYL